MAFSVTPAPTLIVLPEGQIDIFYRRRRRCRCRRRRCRYRLNHQAIRKKMSQFFFFSNTKTQKKMSTKKKVLETLCCPITGSPFVVPVVCADGYMYERDSILKWFRTKNTSPMTGLPLTNTRVYDCFPVKSLITELTTKKPRVPKKNEAAGASSSSSSSSASFRTETKPPRVIRCYSSKKKHQNPLAQKKPRVAAIGPSQSGGASGMRNVNGNVSNIQTAERYSLASIFSEYDDGEEKRPRKKTMAQCWNLVIKDQWTKHSLNEFKKLKPNYESDPIYKYAREFYETQ
jgi:hypothetical protein